MSVKGLLIGGTVACAAYAAASTVYFGNPFRLPDFVYSNLYTVKNNTYPSYNPYPSEASKAITAGLVAPFEKRTAELRDTMITKPLLRFGFTCAQEECTANGLKITRANCTTGTMHRMNIYNSDAALGYSCTYEFEASAGLPAKLAYTLNVNFISARNILKLAYDTYEVVEAGYNNIGIEHYLRPEQATEYRRLSANQTRREPLATAYVNLFKHLRIQQPNVKYDSISTNISQYSNLGHILNSADFYNDGHWSKIGQTRPQYEETRRNPNNATSPYVDAEAGYHENRAVTVSVRPAMADGKPVRNPKTINPLSLIY